MELQTFQSDILQTGILESTLMNFPHFRSLFLELPPTVLLSPLLFSFALLLVI